MTVIEARAIAMTEIPQILAKAKLTEGNTLDGDEVVKTKKILFWNKRVSSEIASSKNTFVIWNVIGADAIGRADNKIARRNVYVSIDIYTKMSDLDERVQNLLEKIEGQMLLHGWAFEQVAAPGYDSENNLNQLSYSAIKKL